MATIALALGADYEDNATLDEPVDTNDWLTDPVQLADWQDQLVNSCNEINRQLNEIQEDLTRNSPPAIPFRLIRDHAGN